MEEAWKRRHPHGKRVYFSAYCGRWKKPAYAIGKRKNMNAQNVMLDLTEYENVTPIGETTEVMYDENGEYALFWLYWYNDTDESTKILRLQL